MSEPVLAVSELRKCFGVGQHVVEVLAHLNLRVEAGEKVAIVGRSGSGKSTLLHLLAGLDTPDSGSIMLMGRDLVGSSNDARAEIRSRCLGFVYQNHHLLPEFTALENVAMPLRIQGRSIAEAQSAAQSLLERVGLAERTTHLPAQLSGGERQRVAVVRSVVTHPNLVLADEPTGNLDEDNAQRTMALLTELSNDYGVALIIVTHDQSMLRQFDRVLTLSSGRLEE